MHTVFINTTKNKIGGRFDSLRNAKDLKKLMYVDCPLDAWNDEETGFRCATQQIADFIDTYNYVNNDYNLVIYVDMVEVFDLLKIRFFDADSVEQALMSKMCKSAIVRLVVSTILDQLNEDGREPSELPVLLLELPKTQSVPAGIDLSERQTEAMLKILRLAPVELLKQKLTVGGENAQITMADILDETKKGTKLDLCTIYHERIQILMDSVCKDGLALQRACDDLYEAIETAFNADCTRNLAVSEYYTNKKTQKLSLEVYTKHNFLLQCFILDCINDETAFNDENEVKQIPELSEDEWEKIKATLNKKKRTYEVERQKIVNLSVDYTTLGLAPSLFKLARERFGLNEIGNVSSEYVIQEVKAEDKKSPEGAEESDNDSWMEKHEELVEQTGVVQNWFDKSVYKPYDSNGDEYAANMGKASAAEYCARARDLANHHIGIFNKLNMHIKRTMANYSGRSISNAAPVLRKRSVNMGENIADSEKNDYIYADRNGQNKIKETDPTESVIETSKRSYISIMIEYLKFDAGRGIAMKNIKDQCDWFINRIHRIEKSLKKLGWILIILTVTLAAAYLPFVLIQWESIVKNVDTLLVALMSLGVPYALLFVFYFIGRGLQKRKMKVAWDDLVETSKKADAENRQAIADYDALMTRYIPSLRWLYEYVLDVDFHCDCCDIARAKLTHHRDKLFERIEDLGNFLEDLDYSGADYDPPKNKKLVEYTNAFCEGENNSDFYSIIDKEMLDVVHRRKRGLD